MNNKFMDNCKKTIALSMCFILLGFNILLFTPNINRQDNNDNFTMSVSQLEKDDGDIPTKSGTVAKNRQEIKVTSRGNVNRTEKKQYTIYKVIANDKEVLCFDNKDNAYEFKNSVLKKTTKLTIKVNPEKQYTKSNVSTKEKINSVKKQLINKYKIPTTYYPTKSRYISSYYGNRSLGWHRGIDIAGSYKDPIYAYKSGKVISTGYSGSYGNMVLIQHSNGMKTRYAHMSSILVNVGEYVSGGQKIGLMGSTGRSTGNHLHFEVIINGENVNPYSYIF